MKKKIAAVLAACLPLFVAAPCPAQEAHNALLIANGEYTNCPSLAQPVSEALALKPVLEELGFTVTVLQNASRTQISEALDNFGNKTREEGGIAFFHYGGHAVQAHGINYILPADADIPDDSKLKTRAVDAEEIMTSMNADANIVILDSFRNNPLPSAKNRSTQTRGIVAMTVQPKNSIIVYSAQAGHTANDGVFTPVLTEKITEKGRSFREILTETRNEVIARTDGEQCPGEYSQLTKDIYLAGENSVSYDLKKSSATGSISITSEFVGSIYMDGNFQCEIPAFGTIILEDVIATRYKIEIKGTEANEFQTQQVVVKRDEEADVFFKVSTGSISITSEFTGDIYLNGKKTGTAQANKVMHIENIKAGTYRVEIKGKETLSRTITVSPNDVADISFYKTRKPKPVKKPRKNIFAVEQKDVSSSGEMQLFYNHSNFNLFDQGDFSADGFGIDVCGISYRSGYPVSFAFEGTSGYTFASASIGKEKFTFHEAGWFSLMFGLEIASRFSILAGVGCTTMWQTFEYETASADYGKMNSGAILNALFPVEVKFRIGEYVSLFGKYKCILSANDSGWNIRHSFNAGISINLWYDWW